MRALHFNEIHVHICVLDDMLQSLTFEELVNCLESIADVHKVVSSLMERAITRTQSDCVKRIDNLKTSKDILDLLDLNNRVVEVTKHVNDMDRVMSPCELIVKVLDVHTAKGNVNVVCPALSILENQTAAADEAEADFKKIQAASSSNR